MADPARPERSPARPPGSKPMSVRELTGAPPSASPPPGQAVVEVEGKAWTVRALGRSGRASGASPPLLLLGFWGEGASAHEPPSLETLVVARALEDLSTEALEAALGSAAPPRDPEKAPAFFPESAQGRRRRPNENI